MWCERQRDSWLPDRLAMLVPPTAMVPADGWHYFTLVDVDFDLERSHVDDRADAGARETAACRDWRHHFARLGILRQRHLALRHLDLLAGRADAREQRVHFGLSLVDGRRGRQPVFHQLFLPPQVDAGFGEPDLDFGNRLPRRFQLRARQHLAFAHRHAFFHIHFDDLAGHLRRHGRAAPRCDVARCVQHRCLCAGRSFGDRDDLDLDWPLAIQPIPGAAAGAAGGQGFTLDAQRRQVVDRIRLDGRNQDFGGLDASPPSLMRPDCWTARRRTNSMVPAFEVADAQRHYYLLARNGWARSRIMDRGPP